VILLGPTAVGKSSAAMHLASRRRGEIINADSMQVYRGFDIGTDKPSPEDRRRIPHHLLDVVEPREQYTAADFAAGAQAAVKDILSRGALPLIVGGTGLYLKALVDGLFPGPGRDPDLRARLNGDAETQGLDVLYERLERADPDYAQTLGRRDRLRIIRALEVYETTGIPLSEHFKKTRSYLAGFRVLKLGLQMEREPHRRRIDERVDRMFAAGLVEEVRGILARGVPETAPPFRALGYRHALEVLKARMTAAEAAEQTKNDTRRYAKRQMTWFRKTADVRWFAAEDIAGLERCLESVIQ
jgi:tRNA dimethylallyltransferase